VGRDAVVYYFQSYASRELQSNQHTPAVWSEVEESLEIASCYLLCLTIKLLRSQKILGLKVLNLCYLEELSNLFWDQIFVEKWMRFFGFRLPFRPSLVRLCKRHPRGESEGIFEWVLPFSKVRTYFLGCSWGGRGNCKTGKTNLGQTCRGPNGWKVRGKNRNTKGKNGRGPTYWGAMGW
jgi:hypothetical protein